jgi:hypothetical protein
MIMTLHVYGHNAVERQTPAIVIHVIITTVATTMILGILIFLWAEGFLKKIEIAT